MVESPYGMTRRERQVVFLLVEGYNYNQIGEKIELSYSLVREYARRAREKMEVTNNAQLGARWVREVEYGLMPV